MLSLDELKAVIDRAAAADVSPYVATVGSARITVETGREAASAAARPARRRKAERAQGHAPDQAGRSVRAVADGIVHLKSSPEAPPFVQPGQAVAAGDTVCLIEVMKTFHAVTAMEAGRVERVCVADGQHVGFGDALITFA